MGKRIEKIARKANTPYTALVSTTLFVLLAMYSIQEKHRPVAPVKLVPKELTLGELIVKANKEADERDRKLAKMKPMDRLFLAKDDTRTRQYKPVMHDLRTAKGRYYAMTDALQLTDLKKEKLK